MTLKKINIGGFGSTFALPLALTVLTMQVSLSDHMLSLRVTDVGVGFGHVKVEMVKVEIAPVGQSHDEPQCCHLPVGCIAVRRAVSIGFHFDVISVAATGHRH